MGGPKDIDRLVAEAKRRGWTYPRGISRDDPPVARFSAAQRRWIGAFARPRTSADAVPARLRSDQASHERFGYPVSRKLRVVGGGLREVWMAPGGVTQDRPRTEQTDLICFLGSPLLTQCKFGQHRWRRPLVELVSCTQPGMARRRRWRVVRWCGHSPRHGRSASSS